MLGEDGAEAVLPAEDAGADAVDNDAGPPTGGAPRWRMFVVAAGILTAAFSMSLISLAFHAAGEDLHSHILLIPFVSAYLIYLKRHDLPKASAPSWWGALVSGGAGLGLLSLGLVFGGEALSRNDSLSVMVSAYLGLLLAATFALLGKSWIKTLSFPVFFLVFMIPLPDLAVVWVEHWLVLGTAEVVNVFFQLCDIPFLRADRTTFELPAINAITVAQECSGIRSSWVLIITSLLASHMFLQSPWRRGALVAVIIPLGILRNAFRILVIVLLCVHVNPEAIDWPIHHSGGPYFFALSLIPLFILLWWLRRGERKGGGERRTSNVEGEKAEVEKGEANVQR